MSHSLRRILATLTTVGMVAATVVMYDAGPEGAASWVRASLRTLADEVSPPEPLPFHGRLEMPLGDGRVCVVTIPPGATLEEYRTAVAEGCAS